MHHSYVGDLIPFTLLIIVQYYVTNFISWYQERIKSNQANRFLRQQSEHFFQNFSCKIRISRDLTFP